MHKSNLTSRPDGTERSGKTTVKKEVGGHLRNPLKLFQQNVGKQISRFSQAAYGKTIFSQIQCSGVKDHNECHHGYGGLCQLQVFMIDH